MKRNAFNVAFPAALVVVMVTFLSTIFLVTAAPSLAATVAKKTPPATRPSAVDHAEVQIKDLQTALKITEAQQSDWNHLTLVMRENAKEMDAGAKERQEISATANAVDRMKFHSHITELRLNQMRKFIPPFEAFYAGMSDEQKKTTDTIFQTGRHDKKKRK
ncbi:MAG: Spy/CpxP family protein refolding chaperone [Geobacteraceae bacterium]|nr:Spy/CpxP family protein refolding chaperone [Geobacteraceae bacterium]